MAGDASNMITAATRKALMNKLPVSSKGQHSTVRPTEPSAPGRHRCRGTRSEMVGFAGFWRRKPVVPNRTALRTAIEQEPHGDHGQQQSQSAKHLEKLLPNPRHHSVRRVVGLALHTEMRHQNGFRKMHSVLS